MIKLKHSPILGQGANRVCYIHPHHTDKILKIIKPSKSRTKKKQQAPWYKKLRPASCFDDNVQEFKAFQVMKKTKPGILDHFPELYGFEKTDLGDALCVEFIKTDPNSTKSLSLEQYLENYGLTEEITKALNNLCVYLYNNLIITRDLRCFNIMIRYNKVEPQLVIVDGLGNPEFIPISNYLAFFGRAKIKRKLNRFQKRLNQIYKNIEWHIPALG